MAAILAVARKIQLLIQTQLYAVYQLSPVILTMTVLEMLFATVRNVVFALNQTLEMIAVIHVKQKLVVLMQNVWSQVDKHNVFALQVLLVIQSSLAVVMISMNVKQILVQRMLFALIHLEATYANVQAVVVEMLIVKDVLVPEHLAAAQMQILVLLAKVV